jgi:hypothetical protein
MYYNRLLPCIVHLLLKLIYYTISIKPYKLTAMLTLNKPVIKLIGVRGTLDQPVLLDQSVLP